VLRACEAGDRWRSDQRGDRRTHLAQSAAAGHDGIVGTTLQAIYEEERRRRRQDSQADITKAKVLLGYEPTVTLEEGLKQTLEWCRSERTATRPVTAWPQFPPGCVFSPGTGIERQ